MSLTALELREWLRSARKTVVLTGAGISVASGIQTYRGAGGLWTETPDLVNEMRAGVSWSRVWQVFGPTRTSVTAAEPNAAHHALVALGRAARERGAAMTVITQNVDGLHHRAGQQALIELHGRLCRSRCSSCSAPPFDDPVPHGAPPPCPGCGAPLRPDVVLFDEPLGALEEVEAKRAFRGADLFLAIGTSGTVSPASSYVRWAKFEGARTAFINLEALEGVDPGFDRHLLGRAEVLVPQLTS